VGPGRGDGGQPGAYRRAAWPRPGYISSKTLCRSRSQSPYLTAAISEVLPYRDDPVWLARAAAAAEREYRQYWTTQPRLTETGLSRYVDPGEDGCATVPDTAHYRAMAESGWDNTGRFGRRHHRGGAGGSQRPAVWL
jgi:neutral trehalase